MVLDEEKGDVIRDERIRRYDEMEGVEIRNDMYEMVGDRTKDKMRGD